MAAGTAIMLGRHRAVVPVQIEKFPIFRTIFWVFIRDNYDITGSTGLTSSERLAASLSWARLRFLSMMSLGTLAFLAWSIT